MDHIFISYSHKDKNYVRRLKAALETRGFDVWIDEHIDYGSEWPMVIQEHLDACSAFILVATENSYQSKWVQKEVARAQRINKAFFPLLLSGDPWLTIESTQYFDVRNKSLPSEEFFEDVANYVSRTADNSSSLQPGPTTSIKDVLKRITRDAAPVIRIAGLLALAAAILWGGSLIVPVIIRWFPTQTPTATQSTDSSGPLVASTVSPVQTTVITGYDTHPDPSDFLDSYGIPMRLIPSNNDSASFYIDKYEVTNEEYKLCDTCAPPVNKGAYTDDEFASHPVIYVSWDMAKDFCEWRGARLPTAEEWKLAAYGVDNRNLPWGNEFGCDKANYGGCTSGTLPVGSYKEGSSPYKVYDMAGNVREWIDANFQNLTGYYLVLGGSYNSGINDLKKEAGVSNNDIYSAVVRDVGFRCAKDVTP